jgi:hypothetical protein
MIAIVCSASGAFPPVTLSSLSRSIEIDRSFSVPSNPIIGAGAASMIPAHTSACITFIMNLLRISAAQQGGDRGTIAGCGCAGQPPSLLPLWGGQ